MSEKEAFSKKQPRNSGDAPMNEPSPKRSGYVVFFLGIGEPCSFCAERPWPTPEEAEEDHDLHRGNVEGVSLGLIL